MRTNHFFPGDVILKRADQIELKIHRRDGRTAGVEFSITGFLMDPFVDCEGNTIPEDAAEAQAILRALLQEGGEL